MRGSSFLKLPTELSTQRGGKKEGEEKDDDEPNAKVKSSEFDYLVGMPMWNLTMEKVIFVGNIFLAPDSEWP